MLQSHECAEVSLQPSKSQMKIRCLIGPRKSAGATLALCTGSIRMWLHCPGTFDACLEIKTVREDCCLCSTPHALWDEEQCLPLTSYARWVAKLSAHLLESPGEAEQVLIIRP